MFCQCALHVGISFFHECSLAIICIAFLHCRRVKEYIDESNTLILVFIDQNTGQHLIIDGDTAHNIHEWEDARIPYILTIGYTIWTVFHLLLYIWLWCFGIWQAFEAYLRRIFNRLSFSLIPFVFSVRSFICFIWL